MIFAIKDTIGGWPDEFQDIVFKETKASDFSNVMVNTVRLNNSWGKKRINMFCFEKGVFFSISRVVKGML